MSQIGGPGEPIKEIKSEKEDEKTAERIDSEGGELPEIKPRFEKIPILNRIEAFFIRRQQASRETKDATDKILRAISNRYPSGVEGKQEWDQWFTAHLKPVLMTKSKADLELFRQFIFEKNGISYLQLMIKSMSPKETRKAMPQVVDRIINTMKTNPEGVKEGLFAYTKFLVSIKDNHKDVFNFFDNVIKKIGEAKRPNYLNDLLKGLDSVTKEQNPSKFFNKYKELAESLSFISASKDVKHKVVDVSEEKILQNVSDQKLKDKLSENMPSDPETRNLLRTFLDDGGSKYFNVFLEANPQGDLSNEINHVAASMKNNPELAKRVFELFPRVEDIMADRFDEVDKYNFLNQFINELNKQPYHEAIITLANFEKVLDQHDALLPDVRAGKVISTKDPRALDSGIYAQIIATSNYLAAVAQEITETVLVLNHQIGYQSVASSYSPRQGGSMRTLEHQIARRPYDFSLLDSLRASTPELKFSSGKINFNFSTDNSVRNPKTKATRTLKFPYPLEGEMTKTQARLRMELLYHVCAHGEFDNFYALKNDKDLDATERETLDQIRNKETELQEFRQWVESNDIQTTFENWWKNYQVEESKKVLDLGAANFQHFMDSEVVRAALNDKDSISKAVEVAKQENIINLGAHPTDPGALSLLPRELDSELALKIGRLSYQELRDATNAVRQMDQPTVSKLSIIENANNPQLRDAQAKFLVQRETIYGSDYLTLSITISLDPARSITRKTTYEPREGQTDQELLNEIIASGDFHADLLLAKAEFMRNFTRV